MATNYYRCELTVHFGGKHPATYAGYYISSDSDNAVCTPFSSVEKRELYHQEVQRLIGDCCGIAESAALSVGGDSEEDRQWGLDLLVEELSIAVIPRIAGDMQDQIENLAASMLG